MQKIRIIGGGLAGVEAAYYLLKKGVDVFLYEMRPTKETGAHHSDKLGELVCSNSLKGNKLDNACGLLKEELRHLDSICMKSVALTTVPSGNALSVDRDAFSDEISGLLRSFSNFHLVREEILEVPNDDIITIIATGPLTSEPLLESIKKIIGDDDLFFFDASAPIIKKDSIDFTKAYYKSRYDQGDNSYINCPFNSLEYYNFVRELTGASLAILHSFDKNYFSGCMPIEVMAKRGVDSLRYGPLSPRGLEKDRDHHPFAVLQLRQDNLIGDLYNLVGFQTNLTYPEQKRVFRMIPGLENAEFVRYGLMHRNSYLNSPKCLDQYSRLRVNEKVFIAGQLSGVEGYVESMMSGLIAGINAYQMLEGKELIMPPLETMSGSILNYTLTFNGPRLEPMNANYGVYLNKKKLSKDEIAVVALNAIDEYKRKIENDEGTE